MKKEYIGKDSVERSEFGSATIYMCVTVIVAMLLALLFYVLCSRRFKLNWYEKTQLELKNPAKSKNSTLSLIGQKLKSKLCRKKDTDKIDEESMTKSGIQHSMFFQDANNALVKYVQPGSKETDCKNEDHSLENESPKRPQRPRLASMHSKLDHTKINAALYEEQQENEIGGSDDSRGFIYFTIHHDTNLQLISVCLKQACDLFPRDFSGTADPYAKVRLLPDTRATRKSCVHKNTTNPQFNEEFVFDACFGELSTRILQISIYDFDEYSRDECIGSVDLPFNHLNLSQKMSLWKELTLQNSLDQVESGEIMISLCYLPSAQRLTVVILKTRGIKCNERSTKEDDLPSTISPKDYFVKVVVHHTTPSKKFKKKKRTSVHRTPADPTFNEALNFDITKDILENMILDVVVVGFNNINGQNEVVGKISIGSNLNVQTAKEHFDRLISCKGSTTTMWHQLTAANT